MLTSTFSENEASCWAHADELLDAGIHSFA